GFDSGACVTAGDAVATSWRPLAGSARVSISVPEPGTRAAAGGCRSSNKLSGCSLMGTSCPSGCSCGFRRRALLFDVVAGSRDGVRELAEHCAAGRLVFVPVGLVAQRRKGDDLALVETGERGVDHVVGRHHDRGGKLMQRLAGTV